MMKASEMLVECFRRGYRQGTRKYMIARLDGRLESINATHQHTTLPKAAEETGSEVRAFERNGSKYGIAIGETVPVVVPSCTRSELGEGVCSELVIVFDLAPPFPSRSGGELGYFVLVEFLDVYLCRAHYVGGAKLEGVGSSSWKMRRDGDRKDFAMGEVDELCRDGRKGNSDSDAIDLVERHGA